MQGRRWTELLDILYCLKRFARSSVYTAKSTSGDSMEFMENTGINPGLSG